MRMETTMRRPIHPLSNSIHLGKGNKPKEINTLSTISTYNEGIDWREEKGILGGDKLEIGISRAHRKQVDRVDRRVGPPIQKWEGHRLVQVGHPIPVKRLVSLNESGTPRIWEDHARAKLTDAEVEAIRDEYETPGPGEPGHVGYKLLARKWGVPKLIIRDICNNTKGNQRAGRSENLRPGRVL